MSVSAITVTSSCTRASVTVKARVCNPLRRPRAWGVAPPRLVLASASPARRRLLEQAGFAPEVRVSGVDEEACATTDPAALVRELAAAKARAVASLVGGDALVIGCDSVLDVDGVVHGKPATVDEARERLQRLRGRTAVLRTGHH